MRLCIKAGAEVKVILTPTANQFVSKQVLSVLSKNEAQDSFFSQDQNQWNNHVELGLWADLMLIAPATANTIAKMAQGFCDNLVLATYLSARCPVMVSPAMDLDMYQHPAFEQNLSKLRSFGNIVLHAENGELASGLVGLGRMPEPQTLFEEMSHFFAAKQKFAGKTVLVTAGPTFENLDPVRFLGNYSTGKMGYAIAEEFVNQGANVILISGPCSLNSPHRLAQFISINSAQDMLDACLAEFVKADIAIMAAAVADYRPAKTEKEKIKKNEDSLFLELVKNPDILRTMGSQKRENQILVGFALETQNELEHAKVKLQKKNLDMIVLNSLRNPNAGFAHSTNQISILTKTGKQFDFELKLKTEVAADIVNVIHKQFFFNTTNQ